MSPAIGTVVGSYLILKQIGSGGMGSVFEAVHTLLPRHVAIKVLHPELRNSPGMDARMVQEAAILDTLQHPGIVRVFDCGLLDDQRPWIAMELVVGDSLASRLAERPRMPAMEVCKLVAALGDILAAVHPHDIVHRDLKPENVLFADGSSVRIIDWGIAHLGATDRLTQSGVTCGTPMYMSPEQATGQNIAGPCDIYSLGVMAYEALAGRPPFEGRTVLEMTTQHLCAIPPSLAALCPAAPRALCDLIHRMLAKEPELRPTAVEIRDATEKLAESASEFESYEIEPLTTPLHPILPTSSRLRWTPDILPSRFVGHAALKVVEKS